MLQNITILLIGAIFLLSSSGYVLYQSSCLCTGEEQTSVFIRPETCETTFHKHHQHDNDGSELLCSAEACHDCSDHSDDCGCESPKVFFFKLKHDLTNEGIKFVKTAPIVLVITRLQVFELLLPIVDDTAEENFKGDPPLEKETSLDFLIEIQQLKIPSLTA